MNYPMPTADKVLTRVPVERIDEVAGLYFRSVFLAEKGTIIPQHTHDHDHATLVCAGAARVWVDGEYAGDFEAGQPIEIKAGCSHIFQSLADDTRLCCVHDIENAESMKRK